MNDIKTIVAIIREGKKRGYSFFFNEGRLEIKRRKSFSKNLEFLDKVKKHESILKEYFKNNLSKPKTSNISIQSRLDKIPLSYAQERLWFIDRLQGSLQYHMPTVLRLQGALDKNLFESAFKALINRHELLRTVIKEVDGIGYQDIQDVDSWGMDYISDYEFIGEEHLQLYIDELISIPYELSKESVLRVYLIRLSEEEHILLVIMHHIGGDGWSQGIMIDEFVELYNALREDRAVELTELPIQYADYAIWQREYLSGEVLEEKLGYWKEQLFNYNPLVLPLDYPRSKVQSTRGAYIGFSIEGDLYKRMKDLCQQEDVTLFMLLVSVFKIMLSRYSGQEDIVIGIPIAGRTNQELEGLLGFFVNSLVLRSDLSGDPLFKDHLRHVRDITLAAYDHQEVPFEHLVEELEADRDMDRNPIFQIGFGLHNVPKAKTVSKGLGNLEMLYYGRDHITSIFDMKYDITKTPYNLEINIEYCIDLFKESTIIQMFDHYRALLTSVVKTPETSVGDLEMLTSDEQYELLEVFNATKVDYPIDKSVVDLFEEQVEKKPDVVALVYKDSLLSYGELNKRSNQLGHYLREQDVRENSLVGICMDRSLDMLIGIFGILKAGGAYAPIDPEYLQARINYISGDAKFKILLTSSTYMFSFPLYEGNLLILDLHREELSKYKSSNLTLISSSDLAYVIYTSGSTGIPKGTLVNHLSLYNYVLGSDCYFAGSTSSRGSYLHFSLGFDACITSIFVSLSNGSSLVIDSGNSTSVFEDANLLLHRPYSFLKITPSHLSLLASTVSSYDLSFSCLSSVYVFGGESLEKDHLSYFLQLDSSIHVYNEYGPTEATVGCVLYSFSINDVLDFEEDGILIGRPMNNVTACVMDNYGRLQPKGVSGELCVGGYGLSRGYLNCPELTSDKFISNPFREGEQLYKTGDLCRWNVEGNLAFKGRKDSQVKVRGYRIELGEVESVMNELDSVGQSIVLHHKDDSQDGLIGYYILDRLFVIERSQELYISRVSNWQSVYEEQYEYELEGIDYRFDIRGWDSSFTGVALPSNEMRLWLDDILSVIMKYGVSRVLEIGTGSGMIYYGLLKNGIDYYLGTDFSNSNLDRISSRVKEDELSYPVTELEVCGANDLDRLEISSDLDTIVINSVIQYFPGESYLEDVISKGIRLLSSSGGGRIVIGDVRDYRLLNDFYRRLLSDRYSEGLPIVEYEHHVWRSILQEEELCISPSYFYSLQEAYPEISEVDLLWKEGDYENELSLYRYNVVLHIGSVQANVITPNWMYWDSLSLSSYRSIMESFESGVITELYLKDVPNPRLEKEGQLRLGLLERYLQSIGELFNYESKDYNDALTRVRALLDIAMDKGYTIARYVSEDALKMHLVISNSRVTDLVGINYNFLDSDQMNIPLYAEVEKILIENLQSYVSVRLPDYMCPFRYVGIDKVPLTHNGKVDKRLLRAYGDVQELTREYVAPQNEMEKQLAAIWQEILSIDRAGINDNFFELGGHSLLAIRVVSMISKELELEISVRDLFEYPMISKLSTHLGTLSPGLLVPRLKPQDRPEQIPLSFAQERLWFIDKLQGSVQYHQPVILRLQGRLDKDILESSFIGLVSRHEILRTVIKEQDGVGYQYIEEEASWSMDYIEDYGFTSEEHLQLYLDELINIPYVLSKESILRVHLIRLSDEEHILLVMTHHIGSDGWSVSVMIDEFVELYNALEAGREISLAALPIQYADYSLWQRDYLSGELLEDKLKYWEDILGGVAPLELSTDYVRPAIQSTQGASRGIELEGSLLSDLQVLCRDHDVTMFMLLLSVFKVLLYRYSGQVDICVGSPIAGRTQKELEGLIGFFINTLALRSRFNGDIVFTDLLEEVKQTTLGAYEHQDVPFEKIVDHLGVERDMSRSALFQVMFVLQNTPESKDGLSMGDLVIYEEGSSRTTSLFDLTLSVTEHSEGLSIGVEYCTALFMESTIAGMLIHYKELLLSVIQAPEVRVGDLDMLTNEERHELLEVFNDTEVEYPRDKSIVDLFEEQVLQSPDSIALVYEDSILTYQELNKRSNQLGHYLREEGVRANSLVGICLDRGLDMVIGILGILKSGGGYVPMDPSYPEDRISYILEDTGVSLVLSSGLVVERLKFQKELLIIDLASFEYTFYSDLDIALSISSDSLAYIIYTSGSTGLPKGSMNDHSGIFNRLQWAQDTFGLTVIDVVLQKTTFCFDVSVWELLWPLLFGSRLVFAKPGGEKDTEYLKEVIAHNSITTIHFVPSMLDVFLYDLEEEDCWNLQRVLCSGEALKTTQVTHFYEKLGSSVDLYNLYGPTEAAIDVTFFKLSTNVLSSNVIPIGVPISNTQAYILDKGYSLLPKGGIGELSVGGIQASRGYLNRPDLTIEKFISNPFEKGNRLYKTGDLARWNVNGNLEFVGRLDNQVKIRGYRIELGEIESILNQLSEVKQGVVMAKGNEQVHKRLIGYVIAEDVFDKKLIQKSLHQKLPDYMIPEIWVELNVMPLTNNGKVDRKGLPDPDLGFLENKEYVAPRNTIEEKLVMIWQDVLGLDQVSVYDNFFSLGGDSIFLIRVASQLKKVFKKSIKIIDLYQLNTINQLAKFFDNKSKSDEIIDNNYNKIKDEIEELKTSILQKSSIPENIEDVYPMTDTQRGMLYSSIFNEELALYLVQFVYAFNITNFDLNLFEKSFSLMVDKHSILRTAFNTNDYEEEVQIVLKKNLVKIGYEDLTSLERTNQENFINDFISKERSKPFEIDKPPLCRVNVFKTQKDEIQYVFQFHGAILDGWSVASLNTELSQIYTKLNSFNSFIPEPLKCNKKDAVIEMMMEKKDENNLSFWKNELKEYKRLDIFSKEDELDTYSKNYDIDYLVSLKEYCKENNISLKTLLFSAHLFSLSFLTYEDDYILGLVTNTRPLIEDGDKLLGSFLNTIPFRTVISSKNSITWWDYLLIIDEKLTLLKKYERLSLFEISKNVEIHSQNENPFFDILFNYTDFHIYTDFETNSIDTGDIEQEIEDDPLKLRSYEITNTFLDLNVSVTGDFLNFSYVKRKKWLSHISLEDFHSFVYKTINCFINHSDEEICLKKIISIETQRKEIERLNETKVEYPENDLTLVHYFDKQVMKTPNQIAVAFEDQILTYKALDEKSIQLAILLRNQEIKESRLIGVCMDRSLNMIISLLAILKSGNAYVPLDPKSPQRYLDNILKDICLETIICNDVYEKLFFKNKEFTIFVIEDVDLTNIKITDELRFNVSLESPAYVIYTSGSTGKPKGVINEHKGVINRLLWAQDQFNLTEEDIVLQKTTFCFDVSVWELFLPLITGSRLVFAKPEGQKDIRYLEAFLNQHKISMMHFVPSVLSVFLQEIEKENFKNLKRVLCSGEALQFKHVEQFKEKLGDVSLNNLYGPTEAAIDVSNYAVIEEDILNLDTIPIGRPVSNTFLSILDKKLNHVRNGVVGELHIGGVQVARGYLNRPELTNERFISDPIGIGCNSKLYKTGDLARLLEDNNIEYLGRIDDQIKIRGIRIELGEIEAQISNLYGIQNAKVMAVSDTGFSKKIVCYFIPDREFLKSYERELYSQQINNWKSVYDITYSSGGNLLDEEFNSIGWNDSFTGDKMPDDQMRVWLEDITELIKFHQPKKVLEIGCGTGMIFYKLADYIEKYIGIDISEISINQIKDVIRKEKRNYPETEFNVCSAHEVTLQDGEEIDMIVINSVIQLFPGESYLSDVISKSLSLLNGKGTIIIGDVRDNRLLKSFISRLLKDQFSQTMDIKSFEWQVERKLLDEEELCLSPQYFYNLKKIYPEITHVNIELKNANFISELTAYRYNVVISVGDYKQIKKPKWKTWKSLDKDKVLYKLKNVQSLAISDMPNPKLYIDKIIRENIEQRSIFTLREISESGLNIVDHSEIDEIIEVAKKEGFKCHRYVNLDQFKMNLYLTKDSEGHYIRNLFDNQFSNKTSNTPLFRQITEDIKQNILKGLKHRLPDYMIPGTWIGLDKMPLTSTGKIDKKVFLHDELSYLRSKKYVAPRNEVEEQLVEIWQELLGVEKVGVYDDFFELGGHSLLAMKLITKIYEKFSIRIMVADIFTGFTISSFFQKMESNDFENDAILISINNRGSKREIFCAPPGDGRIGSYYGLANALGDDQPFYAFQCPGTNGEIQVFDSIRELAFLFIKEMQKIDPSGPYRLGGYSFGAKIVYEMAVQLEEKGYDVEELLIFDGHPTNIMIWDKESLKELLFNLIKYINENFNASIVIDKEAIQNKEFYEQLDLLNELINNSDVGSATKKEMKGYLNVMAINLVNNYEENKNKKIKTKIKLFKCEMITDDISKHKEDYYKYDNGWQDYAENEVEIFKVPCSHGDLMSYENVQIIVDYIRNYK